LPRVERSMVRQRDGQVEGRMIGARVTAPRTSAQNRTNSLWLRQRLLALRSELRRVAAYGDRPLTNQELEQRITAILDGKDSPG
jgi:hypothetical protein